MHRICVATDESKGISMITKRYLIQALCALVIMTTSVKATAGVIVDGLDWLQPKDFTNLGAWEVAKVCDESTGLCDGVLNGIDITGYRWATNEEVEDLFNSSLFDSRPNRATKLVERDSIWAPAILELFTPTLDFPDFYKAIYGVTRTQYQFLQYAAPGIFDRTDWWENDLKITGIFAKVPNDTKGDGYGVWLYKQASNDIPEPSTYVLMALSLLIVNLRKRKRETIVH